VEKEEVRIGKSMSGKTIDHALYEIRKSNSEARVGERTCRLAGDGGAITTVFLPTT
jgi:hypothetical protein